MSNGNSVKIGYNNLRSKSYDKAQGIPADKRNQHRGRMMQDNSFQRDNSQSGR